MSSHTKKLTDWAERALGDAANDYVQQEEQRGWTYYVERDPGNHVARHAIIAYCGEYPILLGNQISVDMIQRRLAARG